jgi:hypothetical protein
VLRLAWSAVGVTTVATGALIALNLPPGSAGAPPGQAPALALLDPTGPVPIPNQDGGAALLAGIGTVPSSPPATAPLTDAAAPVAPLASAPRRTAPVPSAPVADTSPVTAVIPPPADEPPPAEPSPSSPPAPAGLLDGLVTGVVHILG